LGTVAFPLYLAWWSGGRADDYIFRSSMISYDSNFCYTLDEAPLSLSLEIYPFRHFFYSQVRVHNRRWSGLLDRWRDALAWPSIRYVLHLHPMTMAASGGGVARGLRNRYPLNEYHPCLQHFAEMMHPPRFRSFTLGLYTTAVLTRTFATHNRYPFVAPTNPRQAFAFEQPSHRWYTLHRHLVTV